jgi:RNA polymerase sigma factor (TIGR02999 family)
VTALRFWKSVVELIDADPLRRIDSEYNCSMNEVTRILSAIEQGDACAAEQLLPLVYDELRKLAAQKLACEKPGQTLDATALVHEAYLRLVKAEGDKDDPRWDSRGHFFAAAAEAMRRILVGNARRKHRVKHGGDRTRQDLDEAQLVAPEPREDLLALDEALTKLAEVDPTSARLVQLRYFAGLTIPETAKMLGISARTADRLWVYARAWLHQEIQGTSEQGDNS